MPICTLRSTAVALCHLLVWCCLATAQEGTTRAAPEGGKSAGEAAKPAAVKVEEVGPTLFYLKDKQGDLVPVPGFTLKDFEELFRLQNQLAAQGQPPQFSLQRMSATGSAGSDQADLTVQFKVLLSTDRWVRVPLRFDRALLREPAVYKGPGEQFLHFEPEGEGYASWIRGPAGKPQEHELTLRMLVPLTVSGDETRLKLLAPRATTSELKLKVPIAGAIGKVSEGGTLSQTSPVGNGATEFTVQGFGGDVEMTWRKPGGQIAQVPVTLEASGAILARIDSRGVESEATLSVRSHGAGFERFVVRLPADAELVGGGAAGYTVKALDPRDPAVPQQRLVEVQLTRKTSGPVEVRITTRRPQNTTRADEWVELAGFEVVGAVRQWGTIAVAAPSDRQVLWGASDGVRQIDQLPDSLRHDDVFAGFDYFAQPWSLAARLVSKRTRISVEPEYQLLVDADQVRLEAKLKYAVRGAKVTALDVALPEWELDEVGPENVVAVDGVAVSDAHMLSIPLLQPSVGQFEVRVRAHRPLAAGAKSLQVPLPQPRANALAPAVVAVFPADNVELIPKDGALVGLVPEQVAPQITLPERQQAPLLYRGDAGKAVFAADFRVHARSISVQVISRLHLDEQEARVQQTFSYAIAHEPTDHLTIEVPRSLATLDTFEVEYDGKALTPVALSENAAAENDSRPVRMRVALPKACIGECELLLRYPLPLPPVTAGDRAVLSVPLAMPDDGELEGNALHVTTSAGVRVESRQEAWHEAEGGVARAAQQRQWRLAADRRTDRAELAVLREEADDEATTVVEQAWIQSWLTYSARQDRAVFRFTSSRKEIELFLPDGTAQSQMHVLLDGKRPAVRVVDEGRLIIPLPGDSGVQQHLLELGYHFPAERPGRGRLSIELPRLGRDVWIRRVYWELVLPHHEHLLAGPSGFTSECAWLWDGFWWGRKPLLGQTELETWIGAPHRGHVPQETNRYLFSSWGNLDRCEVRTAGRAWIVLLASGAALVVGLLLIYVPGSRHPATLLTAALALLGVGLLYPEPTLLLAQAASLGLGLALLAGLLQRGVARRRGAKVAEASSASVELGSTHDQFPPPPAGQQGSTQAGPVVLSMPNPDANA